MKFLEKSLSHMLFVFLNELKHFESKRSEHNNRAKYLNLCSIDTVNCIFATLFNNIKIIMYPFKFILSILIMLILFKFQIIIQILQIFLKENLKCFVLMIRQFSLYNMNG